MEPETRAPLMWPSFFTASVVTAVSLLCHRGRPRLSELRLTLLS